MTAPAPANGTGSPWREHVAGPVLRGALLCARCGEVLWTRPVTATSPEGSAPWAEGTRIATDGYHPARVDGWPYTRCAEWQPRRGELPVGTDRLAAALADPAAGGFLAGVTPRFTSHLARLLMSVMRRP